MRQSPPRRRVPSQALQTNPDLAQNRMVCPPAHVLFIYSQSYSIVSPCHPHRAHLLLLPLKRLAGGPWRSNHGVSGNERNGLRHWAYQLLQPLKHPIEEHRRSKLGINVNNRNRSRQHQIRQWFPIAVDGPLCSKLGVIARDSNKPNLHNLHAHLANIFVN
jgi:hypothetical protein